MSNEAIARGGNTGVVTEQTGLQNYNLGSCGANAVTIQALALPGVVPGDMVLMAPKADLTNLNIGVGYCLVAGTARIPVSNPTTGALDPAAQDFDVTIFKKVG